MAGVSDAARLRARRRGVLLLNREAEHTLFSRQRSIIILRLRCPTIDGVSSNISRDFLD